VGAVLRKASLVQFFLRIWTKLAFSNNFNVDQTCLLTRDHKFRKEKKWTKLAFSKQLLTWFWTPSNTFLDQNIRLYVLKSNDNYGQFTGQTSFEPHMSLIKIDSLLCIYDLFVGFVSSVRKRRFSWRKKDLFADQLNILSNLDAI